MEQREALRLALVERAKEARKNSYCPYSGFAVRSAQQVAVNPAFSMLHPAYTEPSAHSRAAPTANPE